MPSRPGCAWHGVTYKCIHISLPIYLAEYLKTLPKGDRSKFIAKAMEQAIASLK